VGAQPEGGISALQLPPNYMRATQNYSNNIRKGESSTSRNLGKNRSATTLRDAPSAAPGAAQKHTPWQQSTRRVSEMHSLAAIASSSSK
jgi:hypothetical protein